ncbi:MAG: DNA recombination protein RmuC, partial [Bdellovibrionota bacterium]
ETQALTSALKGDSKIQGDWGELVLENILTAAGLRDGLEYTKQESFEGEGGDKFRPDVLIRLPDDKQIIIDSKVSLKAYEACCRAETPEERDRQMRLHLESLLSHIDDLSEKHYPKLKGLKTPEFVFLFTPIEPAYLMAMRHEPDLATRAWKKGIAIVTATTLFTSLKTVASIWRLEHQNRNAQEIADEAAKLYDKFVGFHDDFEKLGRIFETGLNQYEEARRKLKDGPGNVFRKIELLRELGAAPNKRLKPELLE